MEINSESLRFILGIKVKQGRQAKGMSLKDLAEKTGLSISYLSEIEKGKKYPKPEKIIQLAHGLDKTFDELVSLHLDDDNNPVASLLNSPVFKEFPLQQFGITLSDIFDLVTNTPSKAGAFIRTLLEIGRNYDMQVEHFLLASLRSYQKMHMNYFETIENATKEFRSKHADLFEEKATADILARLLNREFGTQISYQDLSGYPELDSLRSIWISKPRDQVVINEKLSAEQRMFVLAREIGYRAMGITDRPKTSSWMQVESFEQVYNNFKASYFAGALILPEESLVADLRRLFSHSDWVPDRLAGIMESYAATPEMLLHRVSQLMPHYFGMQRMHYLRMHHEAGTEQFHITKELNTTSIFVPRGIGGNEHHCRRWISVSLLEDLDKLQQQGKDTELLISAQRSQFMATGKVFLNIAIARPLSLGNQANSCMILGFQLDNTLKKEISFWNDPGIPLVDVNETCERCPLTTEECDKRVAPPKVLQARDKQQKRTDALESFINEQQ